MDRTNAEREAYVLRAPSAACTWRRTFLRLIVAAGTMAAVALGAAPRDGWAAECPSGVASKARLPRGGDGEDLEVTGPCRLGAGTYKYGNVNIYGTKDKPAYLKFNDADVTFWARSILVENHGSLLAGWSVAMQKPDPIDKHRVTIVLYGKEGDPPITCKSPGGICGADPDVWNSNADRDGREAKPVENNLPGDVRDFFYNYDFMTHHLPVPDATSYFGTKVLAVSYGGTLKLFGDRGTVTGARDQDASDSGRSWVRLLGSLTPGAENMVVDGLVDWQNGDHVVVTTTDYMPGHSEELIVGSVSLNQHTKTTKITFTNADARVMGVRYHHNGERYPLTEEAHPGIGRLELKRKAVETRAAVALLSRNIRIVSGGNMLGDPFPPEETGYHFGGHTMVRQGFKSFQVQGVEFYQLGQGGLIGHYPVHFHLARKTPDATFVKDSSIHDSMTRWITLHATQGVRLARNVGYRSIGHGFYLEDGTETNNKLHSNIGIFARAAVDNVQNPRKVPGILAAKHTDLRDEFPYHSDYDFPTVFWIMNAWNDFQSNMAAGAGTCGACYWLVPGYNSGQENTPTSSYCDKGDKKDGRCTSDADCPPRNCGGPPLPPCPLPVCSPGPNSKMTWKGYAAMQSHAGRAGMTPLKSFVGNSCTAAMQSFQTVGKITECKGVAPLSNSNDREHIPPIVNLRAPTPVLPEDKDVYYPRVIKGAARPATRCGNDASKVPELDCGSDAKFQKCASDAWPRPDVRPTRNCMVTVLDDYTTSFNWAATNFAAVWLRQFWFVLSNSAITDVQNGGLTFVTGGDYTRSSVIDGYWAVATKSVFVGATQKTNPFASALGPFNPGTGLTCAFNDPKLEILPDDCVDRDEGVAFRGENFATNQRLFSIYDGPAYQDSNAYLDIVPTLLPDLRAQCRPTQSEACPGAFQLYGRRGGVPKDATGTCYVPNAAIGWKQPNGFFYPPAFHSRNLYFNNAEIRHFVIEPEFFPGTTNTDQSRVERRYCTYPTPADPVVGGLFKSFTDVDRQTVLNDDDGSLTGLIAKPGGSNDRAERETISVNFDEYFDAPIEAIECGSDVANAPAFSPGTAKTSPYDYLTTAVYPACARFPEPPPGETKCGYAPDQQNPNWASDCTFASCYGVPLYRQHLRSGEERGVAQGIRMMGGNLFQRSTLTADNGAYYIDTAAGATKQGSHPLKNIFEANRTYYVLLVYAKPTTKQVYQLYVGPNLPQNFAETNVYLTRVLPNISFFEFRDQFTTPPVRQDWPSPNWVRSYDRGSGILTVTIDMNFKTFIDEFKAAERDFCLPVSFCTLEEGKCRCNENNPNAGLCRDNNLCGKWAGKDVDWPDGGVYGFGVKFPANFVADDQDHRPVATCIKQGDAGWNVPLVRVPPERAGSCKDTPIPPSQFCP